MNEATRSLKILFLKQCSARASTAKNKVSLVLLRKVLWIHNDGMICSRIESATLADQEVLIRNQNDDKALLQYIGIYTVRKVSLVKCCIEINGPIFLLRS